jgi:hypothetical protein
MDGQMWTSTRLIVVWAAAALLVSSGIPGYGNLAAAQDEEARARAAVTFSELNDSGLSGTAELTARGARTNVSMWIDGAVGDHPTHIHVGRCDDLDPNPKYPLNNVELTTTELAGTSDSVVDVSLDELLASDHLILIHKSTDQLDTYYACGDIVAGIPAVGGGQDTDASSAGSPAGQPLGDMGSGSMSGADGGLIQAGSFGLLAIALGLAALMLRRRELRG